MSGPWFRAEGFQTLIITQYASISDHTVLRRLSIEDVAVVQQLKERISHLPADGDMMISFGPKAEHIDLRFSGPAGTDVIELYNKKFKTPSTGFNSLKSELETTLYRDIDALLLPDFDKPVLLIKDLEIPLPGFSVTYLGSTFHDLSPATITYHERTFRIRSSNGTEETVAIRSGQLPPPPCTLQVNGADVTLLTYETLNGQRLYPEYVQVVRKKL